MASHPQHTGPGPRNLSGADAEDLALYREKFRRRLPESLVWEDAFPQLASPTRAAA
ncbi:hypothetical protein [Streptomyces ipomoeae]|uniref:hypothetical protein n=1 Tax=Streptomyces ipomoeae TaxID=103232 RepID=UPI0015EFE3BA|nr:hypothetical protein [Streptomyces ipomoeae]MDX2931366.1 hypothetical protein [Streptomyces ipomoeae]